MPISSLSGMPLTRPSTATYGFSSRRSSQPALSLRFSGTDRRDRNDGFQYKWAATGALMSDDEIDATWDTTVAINMGNKLRVVFNDPKPGEPVALLAGANIQVPLAEVQRDFLIAQDKQTGTPIAYYNPKGYTSRIPTRLPGDKKNFLTNRQLADKVHEDNNILIIQVGKEAIAFSTPKPGEPSVKLSCMSGNERVPLREVQQEACLIFGKGDDAVAVLVNTGD